MPPRSVKMKRFIFGFQRRVWWPKWTPASRSSRIETTDNAVLLAVWIVETPAEGASAPAASRHRHPSVSAGTGYRTRESLASVPRFGPLATRDVVNEARRL